MQTNDVIFEMVLPRRPVSYNARGRPGYRRWKDYIINHAKILWRESILEGSDYYFQIIYICHENPVDVDNIIKGVQDALVGVLYADDVNISDISAHRRFTSEKIIIEELPDKLRNELDNRQQMADTVYFRLCKSRGIGSFT
ncbi:RusA family crossover junction endodeoxyribonuclease [Deinococcus depolymerans]